MRTALVETTLDFSWSRSPTPTTAVMNQKVLFKYVRPANEAPTEPTGTKRDQTQSEDMWEETSALLTTRAKISCYFRCDAADDCPVNTTFYCSELSGT